MKREGLSKSRKLILIPLEAYTIRLPGKVLLKSSNPRIISIIKGNRLLARKPERLWFLPEPARTPSVSPSP